MENRQKRHKVEEREYFTEDEREAIAAKSDHKCVCCGRKVYFGYGATIDHYIPLKKGGTNDRANLVLMCEDCNKKKKSKVMAAIVGASYLPEPYFEELRQVVQNYVDTYRYISRGNLIAFDQYEFGVFPMDMMEYAYTSRKRRRNIVDRVSKVRSKIMMYRAYPEDLDELVDYFTRYLKRCNSLDSEEGVVQNLKFWMRFGAIYYIRESGNITVITTVVVNDHNYISMNMFPYYSNPKAYTMTEGLFNCISEAIVEENNLPYLIFCINMLRSDTLTNRMLSSTSIAHEGRWEHGFCRVTNEKMSKEETHNKVDDPRVEKFFAQFGDAENELNMYFYTDETREYEWMGEEIRGRDYRYY